MSETAIRLLRPEDHQALAALMVEMQGHYSVPCPAPKILPDCGSAGRRRYPDRGGGRGGARLRSACNLYPGPGLKSGFFLKEIYVADAGAVPGSAAD
jgi:hypothetical protein